MRHLATSSRLKLKLEEGVDVILKIFNKVIEHFCAKT